MEEATSPNLPATPPPVPASAAAGNKGMEKNPVIAAVLSLFPGMGNVYNGLYIRGLTFFAIVFGCIFLAERYGLFGFAIAFFWIFNVIDAYRQAKLINHGYATDLGLTDAPAQPKPGQGGLIVGAILILIGTLGTLESYFDIRVDRILDLWPIGLVAFGAWLVFSALRTRSKETPELEEEEAI